MGIIIYGQRMVGRVESFDATHVVTAFVHVNFFPLVPRGTFFVSRGDGPCFRLRPSFASIALAYLRAFAVAVLAGAAITGLIDLADGAEWHGRDWAIIPIAAVAALLLVASYVVTRVPEGERARRRVYAKLAAAPVDVARLAASEVSEIRLAARTSLAAEGKGLSPASYREALDPVEGWRALAVDPAVTSRGYLEAALTLARLEWAAARGPARAELGALHARIWEKLSALA